MEGLHIRTIALEPKAAARILTTAIDAGIYGIGGWASVVGALRTEIGDKRHVVMVTLEDFEGAEEGQDPKKYQLDLDKIEKAVRRMLADPAGTDSDGWGNRLISDDVDGALADAIVQVACFGKVIYG